MRLLYGTGNPAKLSTMRNRLKQLDIELIGLKDMTEAGYEIPEVAEVGRTPLENARQKALAYHKAFGIPVFSCDSGLYFDEVPDNVQPGVHVRNVNGKSLTDEEMVEYYTGLARQYGQLTARYRNAICLVMDEAHIYESMDASLESEAFIIAAKPYGPIRKKGFPLDSISVEITTGKYYYELPKDRLERVAAEDGFLEFFRKVLHKSGNVYIDVTHNRECMSVIASGKKVLPAGTTVYSMWVKHKNHEYDRFAREYDIHFIFDDEKLVPDFYTVGQTDIFARDGRGGYLASVGAVTDLEADIPICYIDDKRKAYLIAGSGREFLEQVASWREKMVPCGEIEFFESLAQAMDKYEFLDIKDN